MRDSDGVRDRFRRGEAMSKADEDNDYPRDSGARRPALLHGVLLPRRARAPPGQPAIGAGPYTSVFSTEQGVFTAHCGSGQSSAGWRARTSDQRELVLDASAARSEEPALEVNSPRSVRPRVVLQEFAPRGAPGPLLDAGPPARAHQARNVDAQAQSRSCGALHIFAGPSRSGRRSRGRSGHHQHPHPEARRDREVRGRPGEAHGLAQGPEGPVELAHLGDRLRRGQRRLLHWFVRARLEGAGRAGEAREGGHRRVRQGHRSHARALLHQLLRPAPGPQSHPALGGIRRPRTAS